MEIQTLFWNADINQISKGYIYSKEEKTYTCLVCGKSFYKDIIYPVGNSFYTAKKMIEHHISTDHGSMFDYMMTFNKSYTSLSDNQKNVLILMHQGYSDGEIAKKLQITSSTIRNYRFKFREKEKQAKIFLALMKSLHQETTHLSEELITPHKGATQLDDRYNITEKDRLKTLEQCFDEHGKLLMFPAKQKRKIIVLSKIAENFKENRTYSEKEVNRLLKRIYDDYVLIRRYLIQYGFLDRHTDGTSYWVK